jgi:hypothetical protein
MTNSAPRLLIAFVALIGLAAYAAIGFVCYLAASYTDLTHSKGDECCLVLTTHYADDVWMVFVVVFPVLGVVALLAAKRLLRVKPES